MQVFSLVGKCATMVSECHCYPRLPVFCEQSATQSLSHHTSHRETGRPKTFPVHSDQYPVIKIRRFSTSSKPPGFQASPGLVH